MDGLAITVAAAALALLAGGCRDHPHRALPRGARPFQHLPTPVVVGRVRVGSFAELRPRFPHGCLRGFSDLRRSRSTRVVERIGALGRSYTIAAPGSPWLYACLAASGTNERCGGAVGEWRAGRLNDPRLDILCTDRRGAHLGSAWVVPIRRARWISVRERRLTEVYPAAGGLPVRIWTRDGVHYQQSRATFDVKQLSAGGSELTHQLLETVVAG